MSSANSGAVPLPGQYDCDSDADLALYEPTTAQFRLVRSELNWDPAQMLVRQFSTEFIPEGSGSVTQVAGAVPIAGQVYWRWCHFGSLFLPETRLSAVLFFPPDGTWNTMMDPVGSATVNSCSFGSGEMMPLGGTDWNSDGQSDLALYDGFSYDDTYWTLFAKNSTSSDCTGSVTYRVDPGGAQRWRQRVYSVSDMTGDGINDLLIVDPDQGIVRWVTSESGYSTEYSRIIGDPWMEVL